MKRTWLIVAALLVAAALSSAVVVRAQSGQARGSSGWTLPPGAKTEQNPLTVNESVIAAGRKLFLAKCQRCHGAQGMGDGPDADKTHLHHMNLTLASNAAANPDGVVFHKIWNGRSSPKMPRFSEELTKEQVWAIVAYVQTLRAK